MISQHRTRWHCPPREHPHLTLETRDELITHLEQVHPGRFEKAQLNFVADSCARADYPTIQHCPFCSEQAGDLNIHVGQHLQCFALQSLPWPEHLTHNTEGTSKYESDNGANSDWLERATLRDIFDDLTGSEDLMENDSFDPCDPPEIPNHIIPVYPPIERNLLEMDKTLEKFAAAKRKALFNLREPESVLSSSSGATTTNPGLFDGAQKQESFTPPTLSQPREGNKFVPLNTLGNSLAPSNKSNKITTIGRTYCVSSDHSPPRFYDSNESSVSVNGIIIPQFISIVLIANIY